MLLSERSDNFRNNNLDLIRLIAASMVIWSHAYPIVLGKGAEQPLSSLTQGQFSMGDLGVAIFFVISGYLVCQSMLRLDSVVAYSKARVLRIFPGLAFCVLLSVGIIGPVFTSLAPADYFSSDATYGHLVAVTTLNFLSPFLPGVFEGNPYGAHINGSLWTLKYEVICYFTLALAWKLGLMKKSRVLLAVIAFASLYVLSGNEHLTNLAKLSLFFFSGSALYLYRDRIDLGCKPLLGSAVALALFSYTDYLNLAFAIFGSYIILYLGYRWSEIINCTRHGDLSYGLYIYGWPAQQMLVNLFPDMAVWQNIVFAIICAAPLAFISWHCVEKPSMRLRKYRFSDLTRYIVAPKNREAPLE